MLQLKDVKTRMDAIVAEAYQPLKDETDKKYRQRKNKLKKEHAWLNVICLYLKTEPSEEFVKKEKERLQNRLVLIEEGYVPDERQTLKDRKADKKDYDRTMGVPKIKEQLKAIRAILA